MAGNALELRACVVSLEQMLDRARRLADEYNDRVRTKHDFDAGTLKNAIAFSEVRSLDLMCKDALERTLPHHPELAGKWYVHGDKGTEGPDDLVSDLLIKRTRLQHAVSLAEATDNSGSRPGEPSELPREYEKLANPVRLFFEDTSRNCHDYDRNVFIMTRFQAGNPTLMSLDLTIRERLRAAKLVGHRADDRCYPNDRNLWDNVCTYMICCKYGIAVLEDILADEFNPNVALEYGFMRALGKPTLLLKERRFKPRADILGTVWHEFDILDVERSVAAAVDAWIRDLGVT